MCLSRSRLVVAGAVLVLALSAQAQTRVIVDSDSVIGTIQPEVYGQFVEHLGTQIYGGIWVGPDSAIPNTNGFHNKVLEALAALDIPVMRWPGGCFADIYHWRDGIGPDGKRTPRVNMSWGGTPESNEFGTHEFFNLAELLGSKTYLNVNLGSGTVQEAADWLEYITSDSNSALAEERRANGRDAPWELDFLSIGNETWGCGGHMRPAFYADLYTQWATFMKTSGKQPTFVVSGSHDSNIDYSDTVLDHPQIGDLSSGISLHYYTLPTGDWSDKGEATGFTESEWAATIHRTMRMDQLIRDQVAMIERHEHLDDGYAIYVDEWGMWVNGPEDAPALFQQNTIRDAVVAALNFNIFHAHADQVPMTNIAQMVNVLQAMLLVDGPRVVLTPTYHVFEMLRPFQGAESLRIDLDAPEYVHGETRFPAISISAARRKDNSTVIALVNADPRNEHLVEVSGIAAQSVAGRTLSGDSMDSHNTLASPDRVTPETANIALRGTALEATLPPHSVSVWVVR